MRARRGPEASYDPIHGLPYQDAARIRRTLAQAAELRPSRIALYGYAHVPWIKRHQRGLERHGLPVPHEPAVFIYAVYLNCLPLSTATS